MADVDPFSTIDDPSNTDDHPAQDSDLDAALENDNDIDMTGGSSSQANPSSDPTNFDITISNNTLLDDDDPTTQPQQQNPPPESRVPTRKDMSLREFLGKMDDYAPIVCSDLSPCHRIIPLSLPNPPSHPTKLLLTTPPNPRSPTQ